MPVKACDDGSYSRIVRQRPEMKLLGLDFVALTRIAIADSEEDDSETVYVEPAEGCVG